LSEEKTKRNLLIVRRYQEGLTLAELADQHGVDRSRIKQILKSYGIDLTEGGFRVKNQKRHEAQIAAREKACQEMYGVNLAEKAKLDTLLSRKKRAVSTYFVQHRFQMKRKGFLYKLTYRDFVYCWLESGQWDNGGRRKASMVLKPRCKVYKAGNIMINL
jgi:hypothetical protein